MRRPRQRHPWRRLAVVGLALTAFVGLGRAVAAAPAPTTADPVAPAAPRDPAAPDRAPAATSLPAAPAPAAPGAKAGPAPTALPAGFELDVRLTPESPALGDIARYRIEVRYPAGHRIVFPERPALGPFRLLPAQSRYSTEPGQGQGRETDVFDLAILPLRVGTRRLPPIEVAVMGPAGETSSFAVPPRLVRVRSLFAADAAPKLASLLPPVPITVTNWALVWTLVILGSMLVAAGLTLGVLFLLRGRFKRAAPKAPPRPAHLVAYERFAAIEAENLIEAGRLAEFFARVSDAVREYWGNRYGFGGLDLTTTELLDRLQTEDLAGLAAVEVEDFHRESDLVKFAKYTPTRVDAERLFSTARHFVDRTLREVVADEPAPEPVKPDPAGPASRILGFATDLAVAALPAGAAATCGTLFALPWLYGVAAALAALGLLLRDVLPGGGFGRRLARLRLGLVDAPETAPALPARLLRNLPLLVPVVGQTVEFVTLSYDPERRRLGDHLAHTAVTVRRPFDPVLALLLALGLVAGAAFVAGVLPFGLLRPLA